jgi:hypothetical protein
MTPPKLSAKAGDKKASIKWPIVMAAINVKAEQQAIILIDLNGMLIFLKP